MTDAPEAQETADEVARAVEHLTGIAKSFGDSDVTSLHLPGALAVKTSKAIRTILSRLAVLEEERRLDGEATDILVSNILDASFDGETDAMRPMEADDQSHLVACARRIARARLQARKGE